MAQFTLHLGKVQGAKLFSKRYKILSLDMVEAPDGIDVIIAIDQYNDSYWFGASLVILDEMIEESIERYKEKIKASILEQTNQKNIESWMKPMFVQKCEQSEILVFLRKLQKLTRKGLNENGTIIFWGD